jgi:hypothetical protein
MSAPPDSAFLEVRQPAILTRNCPAGGPSTCTLVGRSMLLHSSAGLIASWPSALLFTVDALSEIEDPLLLQISSVCLSKSPNTDYPKSGELTRGFGFEPESNCGIRAALIAKDDNLVCRSVSHLSRACSMAVSRSAYRSRNNISCLLPSSAHNSPSRSMVGPSRSRGSAAK